MRENINSWKVLDPSSQATDVNQGPPDSADVLDTFLQASKITQESKDSLLEVLESVNQGSESATIRRSRNFFTMMHFTRLYAVATYGISWGLFYTWQLVVCTLFCGAFYEGRLYSKGWAIQEALQYCIYVRKNIYFFGTEKNYVALWGEGGGGPPPTFLPTPPPPPPPPPPPQENFRPRVL